ncbi:LytTR family DNA-binding domain-containing protein [Chitinophaga sp. CF418]|uniref:LytR/AlgR family response regulator transcription factor n=1 Tax=Chitinophaga sp. CF418 TaxID=1855287 RepID=UPI00091AB946|nr:LytTR family DNA-binding domain-containing protein [Chitinophaga sp. CF418]SHN12864.1 transcriptional regulator, LytTR family [Chitinophaga sp. CF418]
MEFYINREHLLKEIDYPARYRSENLIRTAAIIFGVILLFLLSFKPFGVNAPEQKMNYLFICCLHALSPATIIYVYFQTFNHLRTKHLPSKSWTLLREYRQIAVVLLLTGIASFLMRDLIYRNTNNWSLYYLWEEIRNCYVGGIFFYFFLRLAGFYFQSKKGDPFVLQFIPLKCEPKETAPDSVIFIHTQVKQDDFRLDISDLLFARAEGNYVELTTISNNQVNTELKRISLSQFEAQLSAYPQFFRSHRTCLVNMLHIEKVSGNSQGYLLSFSTTESKVPVSRAQLNNFNSRYEQLRNTFTT